MYWNTFRHGAGTRAAAWNPWQEMQRLHAEIDRAFSDARQPATQEVPPINVWVGEDGVRVVAEVPGVDAKDIEVTVVGDTLTLKGSRAEEILKDGESYHRQERGAGKFVRTVQLPFNVETDAVKASFKNGVLEIELPRAKSERPRKITIESAT